MATKKLGLEFAKCHSLYAGCMQRNEKVGAAALGTSLGEYVEENGMDTLLHSLKLVPRKDRDDAWIAAYNYLKEEPIMNITEILAEIRALDPVITEAKPDDPKASAHIAWDELRGVVGDALERGERNPCAATVYQLPPHDAIKAAHNKAGAAIEQMFARKDWIQARRRLDKGLDLALNCVLDWSSSGVEMTSQVDPGTHYVVNSRCICPDTEKGAPVYNETPVCKHQWAAWLIEKGADIAGGRRAKILGEKPKEVHTNGRQVQIIWASVTDQRLYTKDIPAEQADEAVHWLAAKGLVGYVPTKVRDGKPSIVCKTWNDAGARFEFVVGEASHEVQMRILRVTAMLESIGYRMMYSHVKA